MFSSLLSDITEYISNMADHLRNYKLQLQQVEGALLGDADNEELLKLKADLEELIELTEEDIETPADDSEVTNIHGSSNDHDVASVVAADDGNAHTSSSNCQVEQNGKGHSKEYLKKKKQKKHQRMKQHEEDREAEKNKWLNFHSKAIKKPGIRTKSIFASPDNLTGRVGVGTCGISGKPMTESAVSEKLKKRAHFFLKDQQRTCKSSGVAGVHSQR
ncbi:survival of motor neuron-related-splicing factor 30-like [Spodoptera litura]|uniref:Survival of motor neuron-related-splicing factor 30-like n=1 Tax=Spodoptera litura TaxID=69820 RepID=A0A9J7J5I6_SPOLT|nr:survival of motor neuron-related-splicing factor 30-like [Spodoptera litura]